MFKKNNKIAEEELERLLKKEFEDEIENEK